MTEIEDLIAEMQEVKTKHPILEIHEVLRLFNIQAIRKLIETIDKLRVSMK